MIKHTKTKIVATIGPACDSPEILKEMMLAGMNVARLNLSHGSIAQHTQRIYMLRKVASDIGGNIAIMVDTKGIEIRTGSLRDGSVVLEPESIFTLYA
ncbi:MAG: pyruvate kinase, partial [Gammaproteobacteria bacterium SG8_11]